jgi:hypothetical protein
MGSMLGVKSVGRESHVRCRWTKPGETQTASECSVSVNKLTSCGFGECPEAQLCLAMNSPFKRTWVVQGECDAAQSACTARDIDTCCTETHQRVFSNSQNPLLLLGLARQSTACDTSCCCNGLAWDLPPGQIHVHMYEFLLSHSPRFTGAVSKRNAAVQVRAAGACTCSSRGDTSGA